MRMDTVTRGSHCSELKRSGTTLYHANEHRYAWFWLFGVETKWNKLVACEWTPLRVVPTVWSWNKVEKASYMRMNTVWPGSHCLELKRSGTSLCPANEHRYAWFPLFGAETKWKKLLTCEWTLFCLVPTVWSWNEVEQPCVLRMNTVTRGSDYLEMKRSRTTLLHANGHR